MSTNQASRYPDRLGIDNADRWESLPSDQPVPKFARGGLIPGGPDGGLLLPSDPVSYGPLLTAAMARSRSAENLRKLSTQTDAQRRDDWRRDAGTLPPEVGK